jgi:diaminohydroxyphosphoribosylaminopyrimidine deaminase/5-amino-6-(5-phosphoribosylamino)uracil reductase
MKPTHAEDVAFLERAVELAWNGLTTTTPNPRVGCVIVRGDKVIGEGWHQWAGQGHAEVNAIAAAGGDVRGATVYVSLEPCSFVGRTPACARRLIDEGVARVVVAEIDPHPKVSGHGLSMLRASGLETEVIELDAARQLNPGWRRRVESGRPFVRVKIAASMDGRTAMSDGESQWITGEAARADVQALRARSCAIVTGIGTVLADDPALTVRDERFRVDGKIRQPLVVIADSRVRTPPAARLFQGAGEVLVAHVAQRPAWLQEKRSLPMPGERVDLPALLAMLAAREINEVLVEAGPTLAGSFLAAGLWDELVLYLAPKFLGSDARPLAAMTFSSLGAALGAKIVTHERVGDDLRLTLHPRERPRP